MFLIDYAREERRVCKLFARQNIKPVKYCKMTHNKCEEGLVYVAKGKDGLVKIGCTKNETTLSYRLQAISEACNQEFTLLFTLYSVCRYGLEKQIHKNLKRFNAKHYASDELFYLSDALIKAVAEIRVFRGKEVTVSFN